jgi:hypothetical protein
MTSRFELSIEWRRKISIAFILLTFCIKFFQLGFYVSEINRINDFLNACLIFFNIFAIANLAFVLYGDITRNFIFSMYVMFLSFIELIICAIIYSMNTYISKLMILFEIFSSLLVVIMMSFVYNTLNNFYNQIIPIHSIPVEPQPVDNQIQQNIQFNNISILRHKYEIVKHFCSQMVQIVVVPNMTEPEKIDCEKCPCTICQESCNEQLIYKLNCEHFFHQDCLEGWIRTSINFTCPICRESLLQM